MNLVAFADLAHTGTIINADNTPLAIGYVAAYAKQALGNRIEPRLFKYPDLLARFLESHSPRVMAFSNYMWNERLSLCFAQAIKKYRPEIVTICGGPNYPINPVEQRRYVEAHPEIDFYVEGEGEVSFTALFEALEDLNFDIAALKSKKPVLPNIHYQIDGDVVLNPVAPRNLNLDETFPSPYLTGVMDEFFDETLNPLMQTSRGCPYSCTFCHDGLDYMNKSRRFSQERVRSEFEYVACRAKVAALTLADLNWGMFPEDIETAKDLARLRIDKGWPQFVSSATAKNQKTRVVEMAGILGNAMQLGASVQSTDPDVLENIKRKNIGVDAIVEMAMNATRADSSTFTEIIVCLAGDTKEKHFKSVYDMLDAGIQEVRTHQLVLLPGTEAATALSRKIHKYKTAFRILPKSFGRYEIFGEKYIAAELNELCIGNATMPHEDYLECRRFNLTLGIFNNGHIFEEILNLAGVLGLRRSALIARIHEKVSQNRGAISDIYSEFKEDDRKNFWDTQEDLEAFIANGGLDRYLSGEYGSNQLYEFRTQALLEHFDEVVALPIEAIRDELDQNNLSDSELDLYLNELTNLLRASRGDLGQLDIEHRLETHFDFESLRNANYRADPRDHKLDEPRVLVVAHGENARIKLQGYFAQYGSGLEGLSYFIHRNSARELYRTFNFSDSTSKATIEAAE